MEKCFYRVGKHKTDLVATAGKYNRQVGGKCGKGLHGYTREWDDTS